jgi:2-polyprenyl-3-methyl-5-hydroxy-6-metoxy-1,4-benzoquinol methylase
MGWKFWRKSEPAILPAPMPAPSPPRLTAEDYEKLRLIMEIVTPESQPNLNHLGEVVRNVRLLSLNIKSLGYDLARQLAAALPPRENTAARHVGLQTSLSTQADLESDWAAHWSAELKVPVVFHRKLWELSYVLQAMYENGCMVPGKRGLGFGSGSEPLSSYLASLGVASTVTDLPIEDAQGRGWIETNQHASGLQNAFHPALVSREAFDRLVDFRAVDMNAIPADLTDYDFCWSVCAFEHLGTIQKGLDFVENALNTLKPGGMAVHTTEFNIEADGPTIDNWPSVLFQRKHIEELAERLQSKGHKVAPLNFNTGDKVLDRFIDLPPFGDAAQELGPWVDGGMHLKVGVDGFIATCIGITIIKAG